jgi:homoserine dehydrogenase
MKEFRIGMIGFGTVGTGVAACIQKNCDLMAARIGIRPVLARIMVRNLDVDRGVEVAEGVLTTNVDDVLNADDIDVVVELIGGTTDARTFVLQAINNGKSIVTANKALLAFHGAEIFAAAEANNVDVYFEASTAGGIPIIKTLREGLAGNRIESIYAILNGTCNYILTRMEHEGIAFAEVLDEAQKLGYAEADPSFDIDGDDTAHKTVILTALAFGRWFDVARMHTSGIRGLDVQDIENAAGMGYKIKLLAIVKPAGNDVDMRVHPVLIPASSMLGQVSDVFNAVCVKGDAVGETMFYGRGAGRDATASAVVSHHLEVGLNIAHDSARRVVPFQAHDTYGELTPIDDVRSRYYIRLQVEDKPDVLSRITHIFGESNISIASILQKETTEPVPVVLMTHIAREKDVQSALQKIAGLDVVSDEPVLLRVEDL